MLGLLFKYRTRMLFSIFRGGAKVGRSIAVVIAFAALVFAVVSMSIGLYMGAKADPEIGARLLELIVSLVFHGIFILLLFTGLSLAIFTVYFGKDLELLFVMPIKQSTVFFFKFTEALILNIRFSLLFLTPALILLGLFYEASALYYVAALAISVFMAAIPGAFGIIVSSAFVGRVSRPRMKNLMAIVGSLLGIGLWAGINALIGTFDLEPGQQISPDFPIFAITSSPVFHYLPSGWASGAAISAATGDWKASVQPIFLLAVFSIVLTYAAMAISSRHYRKGIVEESPEASSVTAINSSIGRSPLMAHLKRDLILLYRQPLVLTQILLMFFLVLLFPYIAGGRQPGSFSSLPISAPIAIFALMFGSQFSSRLVPLEKLGFCWNMMIPGGIRQMLFAKFLLGILSIIPFSMLVGLLHIATGKANGFEYIGYLSLLSLLGLGFGFPIGIIFAEFNWDHPKRMLKGGGVFILVILTIIMGMGIYLITAFLEKFLPGLAILSIFTVAVLALALAISMARLSNFEWTS